ncbi:rhombosortase [Photobacterium damselae]
MSIRTYLLLAIIIGVIAQFPSLAPYLNWDRNAILDGEVWRIVTGNITHTNWPHLIMNSIGFIIITFIFRRHFQPKIYTLVIFALSIAISIGLFATSILWYAGFSGVLHGLFAWGAVKDIQSKNKEGYLLLLALAAKVGWDCFSGGSAESASLIGAHVAVQAHLIGAITGTFIGLSSYIQKNENSY